MGEPDLYLIARRNVMYTIDVTRSQRGIITGEAKFAGFIPVLTSDSTIRYVTGSSMITASSPGRRTCMKSVLKLVLRPVVYPSTSPRSTTLR